MKSYQELEKKIAQLEGELQQFKNGNLKYKDAIINTIAEPASIVDKNYTYLFVNKAYCDNFHKEVNEITGKKVAELVGKENFINTVKPHIDECLQGKNIEYENIISFDKNQADIHLLMNYYPYYNETGEITGIISTAKDISNEIKLQKNWKKSINALDDILIIIDKNFVIEKINQKALQLLNKKAEEVVGKQCFKIIHNSDQPEKFCPLCKSLKTHQPETVEHYEKAFGKWFSLKSSPIFNQKGEIVKFVDLMRDITPLKNNEQKLKESNEEYLSVNEELSEQKQEYLAINKELKKLNKNYDLINQYSSDVVAMYDVNFNPVYISPSSINYSGYAPSEFGEKRIFDIVHPDDKPHLLKDIEQAKKNKRKEYITRYRIKHKDGHYFWNESISHVIDKKGKQHKYIVVNSRNIDDRKIVERKLRENEELFQKMLKAIPDMVSVHDAEMNILYSNWNGFASVPQEKRILHTKCYNTYRGYDKICPDCKAKEVLKSKQTFQADIELPEGKWVDLRVIPILDNKGNCKFFVEWVRDITGRKQIEIELEKETERLGNILSNINIGLIVHNTDFEVSWVNNSIKKLFPDGNPVGKKCYDFFEKRKKPCEKCAVKESFSTGKIAVVESYNEISDRWFLSTAQPLKNDKGETFQVLEAVLEITDFKKNERELIAEKEKAEQSEKKFRALYENAPLAYQSLDENGNFLDVNPAWLKTLEYNKEEVIGKNFGDFLHPDWKTHFAKNFPLFRKQGFIHGVQFKIKHKQGHFIDVSFEGCIEYTRDGKFRQTYCVFKEITEQKKAKATLKLHAQNLKLRNQIAQGFIVTEKEDLFHNVLNLLLERFESDFGYFGYINENGDLVCPTMTEGIWDKCNMSGKTYIFSKEIWNGLWGKSLIKKETLVKNEKLQIPQGHIKLNNAVAAVIINKNAVIGQIVLGNKKEGYSKEDIRSISEICNFISPLLNASLNEFKYQQELIKSKEKAEESDQLKTAFLNNISHEFRTPMNGILGFSELLTSTSKSEEKRTEYARIIRESCEDLLDIVTDTIEISQIQSKQTEIETMEFYFSELINQIVDEIKYKVEAKNIEFIIQNKCKENDLTIKSDKNKIYRSLKHLLDNSLKFTHSGHIKLICEYKENHIQVSVSDTGIGISPEMQEKVLEPFRQVETGTTRRFGGNGIGLSLVKSYIEMLGGEIWLKSAVNKGTTVSFTLPATPDNQQEVVINKDVDNKNFPGKTILLVEDELTNFLYLEELLEETNATILRAENGEQAVDLCRNNAQIDLILMDIKMPVMDGYDATHLIKQFRGDIPIIAQTAYTLKKDVDRIKESAFDGYIAKPMSKKKLFDAIKKFI